MKIVFDTFEIRKNEIKLFLDNLKILEVDSDNIDDTENISKKLPIDFFNILHSNALLMLYNLVESTVLGGIQEIYDAVKTQGLSYKTVSEEIKHIWFTYMFNQVYDKEAHHNAYKHKAEQIIDDIINGKIITLNRKAVNISGNLDANKIRLICKNHGIKFNSPKESYDEKERIGEVRDKRNYLAHGNKSFVECGRDYTFKQLVEIYTEIEIFLNSLLDGMKKYYESHLWENKNK